jgi:ABC-type Fe3+/spermidine/putrescine transport system ATPase subunit
MLLQIIDMEKEFEGQAVLRSISLEVSKGEIVALLGPSGCGKTTLLRIIAGLETIDAGKLLLLNQDLSHVPVHKRGFGMVFQDFALFPHMTVAENVSFGLRMEQWKSRDQRSRIQEMLDLVGLSGFGDRPVHTLSGGEQQRVALARSLAPSPRLLLLDEPLGALDRALRERLMSELRAILKRAGRLTKAPKMTLKQNDKSFLEDSFTEQSSDSAITTIYVTHDQEEAFAIADRVIIMNSGRVEQQGSPVELFGHPQSTFVARFLGMDNLLPARVVSVDPPVVSTEIGQFIVASIPEHAEQDLTLLIRPDAGRLIDASEDAINILSGQLTNISFRGRHQVATIQVPSTDGGYRLRLWFESRVTLPTDSPSLRVKLNTTDLLVLTR